MVLLLVYLLSGLSISFLCSIAEAAILSVTVPFIETKIAEGKKHAKLLKKLKTDIDLSLSAILSLNTVAHTVGAAGVGTQAVAIFGEESFGIVSAILTLLILIFTEIIPKSFATLHWRSFALPMAPVINVMIYITYPMVLLSKGLSKLMSRGKQPERINREEVAVLAQLGLKEGVFAESESKIINNLIRLKYIKVNDIMTPRTVVVADSEDTTIADFLTRKEVNNYSRFPIYKENIDNVTGYVLKVDVLDKMVKGHGDHKLGSIKRNIAICYEGATIPSVFDILLRQREQIALVVDEYGGMEGIVTLEDIIETIFGLEIIDEKDGQIDMQQAAKEKWRKRAENLDIDLTEYD